MPSPNNLFLLLLFSLPLAHAFASPFPSPAGTSPSNTPFGGFASSSRAGPYDANSPPFLSLLAASNATAAFSLPLWDVSQPYPSVPLPGWTLSLAALDIPDAKVPMVGYAASLKAPEGILKNVQGGGKEVDVAEGWGMCIWNFEEPVADEGNNKANVALKADGACGGFLPEGCIRGLEREAKMAWGFNTNGAGRFGSKILCNSLSAPVECGVDGPGGAGSARRSYEGVPIRFLNGSVTQSDGWEWKTGRKKAGGVGDVRKFWDRMVLSYWPYVVLMVDAVGKEGEGLVRVSCVAPNGQGTGKGFTFSGVVPATSKAEGGDGKENGGGRSRVKFGTVLAVVGVVVGAVALC